MINELLSRLKITNQTNETECGVCVLTSLHNYFYHKNISKENVLNISNINDNGLSIFDFEILANKLNIECESYECSWSDFQNLKISKYFVTMLNLPNQTFNHYVICKKNKSWIVVYDSSTKIAKKMSYSQFREIYTHILIFVSKKLNKKFNSIFVKSSSLLLFDLNFFLISVFLSILTLFLSIVCASFLNWLIDTSIIKNSIRNLITQSIIFVFIYFMHDLLNYILKIYTNKHLKSYYLLFSNNILEKIKYKKIDFLFKVNRNWILKIDECIYHISNYFVFEINKFIANSIFILICICLIGTIYVYLLIFVLIFMLIELISFLFMYQKKKEKFKSILMFENKNLSLFHHLSLNLKNEIWLSKKINLIDKIKKNYSNIYKNFNDVTIFRENNKLVKSIFKSFFDIFLISIISFLIIKQTNLTFGKLTFIISLFGIYKNSISDLFMYFIVKHEFDVYWQVYKDLVSVSNFEIDRKIPYKTTSNITIYSKGKLYKFAQNKINLISLPFYKIFMNCNEFFLNNEMIDLNNKCLFEKIIIVDIQTEIDNDYLNKKISDNQQLFSKYLKIIDIDINSSQHLNDKLIINLLCLLLEQQKIIIIDNVINYINPKHMIAINEILNYIKQKNDVFIFESAKND